MQAPARFVRPGKSGVENDTRGHGYADVLAEKRFGDPHDSIVGQKRGDRLVVGDDPTNGMPAVFQILGPAIRRGDQAVADLHHFIGRYHTVYDAPALDAYPLDQVFDG